MTKLLVFIILVVAGTLSYDTEIRASLLNFVGIVKTIADDVAGSLCKEGDQCRRNDAFSNNKKVPRADFRKQYSN